MQAKRLVEIIGSDFYTGVPDSQLKALCNYLMDEYGIDSKHHIIAANEGNCTALAAGYHLATGKVPVVYMQNSGEGNIINPVGSKIDFVGIAKACGYPNAICVDNFKDLDKELVNAKNREALTMIEVKCSIGARDDLGRSTTTARENKEGFMNYLKAFR